MSTAYDAAVPYDSELAYGGLYVPYITCEVAFEDLPLALSPTWTDISDRVYELVVERGRNFELDRSETGTLALVLDSHDGAFDPTNSASVYAPNVRPMRRVRVRATFPDASAYDLFDGYIERWPTRYKGFLGQTSVEASDAFILFSRHIMPSPFTIEVERLLSADLLGWWRMGEPETTTDAFDSSGNERHGAWTANFPTRKAGAGMVSGDPQPSTELAAVPAFTADPDHLVIPAAGCPSGSGAFTVMTIIRELQPDDEEDGIGIYEQLGSASGAQVLELQIAIGSGTDVIVFHTGNPNASYTPGFVVVVSTGTINMFDGEPHLLICSRASDGSAKVWLDGTQLLSGSLDTPYTLNPTEGHFAYGGARGGYQDGICLDRAVTTAEALALWNAVNAPWDGDTAKERLDRVLDRFGWPSTLRELDDGASTLGPATSVAGSSLLQVVQDVAYNDGGLVYIDGSGNVVFHDRHHRILDTTSVATFGDSGSELEYAEIETDDDEQHIRNDVTVIRSAGGSGRAINQDSIDEFGWRPHEVTLELSSQLEAQGHAEWFIERYSNPQPRVTSLLVEPVEDIELFHQALGRQLSDRLTVRKRQLPEGGDPFLDEDAYIEKQRFEYRDIWWKTYWSLTPADPWDYWILGDATYGVLGTTARLAY